MLSLRRYWQGPITLITNLAHPRLPQIADALCLDVQSVSLPDEGRFQSRILKTNLSEYSPYEHSVFLDSDTILRGPIESLLQYDLAMALDLRPTIQTSIDFLRESEGVNSAEAEETLHLCGGDAPHFNSGVIAWRKSTATDRFFAAWRNQWERYKQRDQAALARALAQTATPIETLPSRFNCYGELGKPNANPDVVVWHGCCPMQKHQRRFRGLYAQAQRLLTGNQPVGVWQGLQQLVRWPTLTARKQAS